MPEITVIPPFIPPHEVIRVGAYCRVSTESDEQMHSFAAQKAHFSALFAGSQTHRLAVVYADAGGSGTSDDRPEFRRMIADCRAGKLDRIVTKSVSRLARNTRDCLAVLRELKALGISVYFEKENIDTADISDEIMLTVMGGLAQEESDSISRNIRWSLEKRMKNGTLRHARIPYGYRRSDSGMLAVCEETAPVVRRIFGLYQSGMGARRIAALLTSEDIPSPSGTAWNNVTVLKMLRQEKYLGDTHWQKSGDAPGYYHRGTHPAIISREQFEAVQEIRGRSTHAASVQNTGPFRGKLCCGLCGRSFYYVRTSRAYWQCSRRFSLAEPCGNRILHDADLRQMWEEVCEQLRKTGIPVPAEETRGEVSALSAQYDDLRSRRLALCGQCAEGRLPQAAYALADAPLLAEQSALLARMEQLTAPETALRQERALLRTLLRGSPAELLSKGLVRAAVGESCVTFELIGGLYREAAR